MSENPDRREASPPAGLTLPVLQAQLRACTRCQDARYIEQARPGVWGAAGARFMVIGQAPSRTDFIADTVYVGPAGKRLRSWIEEAGFLPTDFGTRIYMAAITRCFPGRLPGSSKDRLPSKAEQALCRPWLNAELELLQPRVVILFGRLAIETFLSRAPLAELIGHTFEKDGRLYIPLPHSSGASTWLNSTENRALLALAIERIREARETFASDTAIQ